MGIAEDLKNLTEVRAAVLDAEEAFKKAIRPLRDKRVEFEVKVRELLFVQQRRDYMLMKINVHSRRGPKITDLRSEFLYDLKNGFVVVYGTHPEWDWSNGGVNTKCGFIFPFDSLVEIEATGGNDVIQKYWATDVHDVIALGIAESLIKKKED